jgi:hypothetical protein
MVPCECHILLSLVRHLPVELSFRLTGLRLRAGVLQTLNKIGHKRAAGGLILDSSQAFMQDY